MLILWPDPLLYVKIRGVWAIIAAAGVTRKTDKNKVFGPFHPLNINRSFPKTIGIFIGQNPSYMQNFVKIGP